MAKFCSECGTPVTQASQPAEYKQVTVLFAELVIPQRVTTPTPLNLELLGPNGTRIPVDPEREFGRDWPGHAGHEDDGDTTA